MYDLISIGDARLDNFIEIDEAHLNCTLNQQKCEICLNYGDKIPVKSLNQTTAGNNNNNAIGAARLKLKTAIFCNLGGDANAKTIIDNLKAEGVDTRYINKNEGMATEQSFVLNFKGERTILVYHQPWQYRLPDLEKTKWIYFSSVSYSFSKNNFIKELENYLERSGARLVFTPGTFQLRYGVKKFPRLLSLTHLLIVNLEEAKEILGVKEEKKSDVKKLLSWLVDLGPKMAVITDGSEGSFGYNGDKYYKIDAFKAKLVEMTGAGDSYATGLLSALFYGKALPEAMRWGAANGAAVVEHIGPQKGLLTYEQMQERLKDNASINAKEF